MPGIFHHACCCPCIVSIEFGYIQHADDHATANPTSDQNIKLPTCHKLYVWQSRTYTAGVGAGSQRPDYVITSNFAGQRLVDPIGGPGRYGPFETTQGSGISLDTEPYWWGCIGGWEVAAEEIPVDLATVEPLIPELVGANGTRTVMALFRFREWHDHYVNMMLVPEIYGQLSAIRED